jgi:transposase
MVLEDKRGPVPIDLEMERRREAALKLWSEGFTQVVIADHLKVGQGTVSRWVRRVRRLRKGQKPLVSAAVLREMRTLKPHDGRPPVLSMEQLRAVWEHPARFAPSPRSRPNQWTGSRFANALFETYGVRYSISYSNGLLAHLKSEGLRTRFDVQRKSADGAVMTCAAGA